MRDMCPDVVFDPAPIRVGLLLLSKLVNAFRLHSATNHRNKLRQAERVMRAVRAFREPGMAARCLCYLRQVDPLVFEEVVMSALEDAGFLVLNLRSYGEERASILRFPALG